ncbi:hypothetical protein [Nocardia shimofusensis]|uniref:hypothetical protein n=1 Tax=Nocardia shimofusensis TaxID=228596 RepID=UPI00082B2D58|nr:hypothetical protein [Nocardia shimofusensis]
MRTAVLRIDVDPGRELTAGQRADGLAALQAELADQGAELLGLRVSSADQGLAGTAAVSSAEKDAPPRELQFLLDTADAEASLSTLVTLCARAFHTAPQPGVVTYLSRGTDDDAHGVLAGFGLRGAVTRSLDDDGFDIVHVRLREDDLRRVPESRIHTALEASLNCEVRIDID